MAGDRLLVRLTHEQAAILVYLTSAGLELTGGTWNEAEQRVETPVTESFQGVWQATLGVVPWMADQTLPPSARRIRLLDEYAQMLGPILAWMEKLSKPTNNEGEANAGTADAGT